MNLPAFIQQFPVHYLIMASVALVSLLSLAIKKLKYALMLNPHRVSRGEVHRLLTAGWVHGDFWHLFINLFVFNVFAERALKTFGAPVFVVVYVSAVVVAFIPTAIRHRKQPKYNSLGASGAVAAIMLSAILVDPTLKLQLLLIPIPMPGIVFGVLYILYSAWQSRGSRDNINHDAHFSGAIYGALVTVVWAPQQVERTIRVLIRMLPI